MKNLSFCIIAMLVSLSFEINALGDDVAPAPWRGKARTTYEVWSFTASGPADSIGYGGVNYTASLAPEVVNNTYGSPSLGINTGSFGSGWFDNNGGSGDVSFLYGAKQGFWDIGAGSMNISVPNLASSSAELIQLQITYFSDGSYQAPSVSMLPTAVPVGSPVTTLVATAPAPGAWYTTVYTWQVTPSPIQDAITVTGGSAFGSVIDQVIVDTLVNSPPAATNLVVTRTAGLNLLIAMSDVATNWSDPDGDPVTLTGFNLTSTNGVTVLTNSSWILYTNSLNANDQLSYRISDNYGATNTGYINIVVVNSVTGTNSITSIVTGSTNVINAYGIPGFRYILERSTNLASWVDISTNTAATNGVIKVTDYFSDLGGNPPSSAYYRFKWQP